MTILERMMREQNNIYSSAIRQYKVLQERKRQQEYKWSKRINPSSLPGLEMCPKYFFSDLESKNKRKNNAGSLDKMNFGSAIHSLYQDQAELVPDLKWRIKPKNQSLYALQQQEKTRELVVYDPENEFSGRVDDIIDYQGTPELIEIKTTDCEKNDWTFNFETLFPKKWHIVQILYYYYKITKLKYFPDHIIKRVRLVYINLMWPKGEEGLEREIVIYTNKYIDQIMEQLDTNLTKQRLAYLNNQDLPCLYDFCEKHGTEQVDYQRLGLWL